jgi:hypothetical protein
VFELRSKKEKKRTLITIVQPNQIEKGLGFLSDSALGAPAFCFVGALFISSKQLVCFNRTLIVTRAHTTHLRLDTFWREKCLNGNYRSIHLQEGAFEKTYEADCEIETLKKGTFWEGLLTEKDLH